MLAINWALMWVLYRAPKATVLLAGKSSTLIRDGEVDEVELKNQALTHEDLISVLNKNGFTDVADVEVCVLEPNGTFFVQGKKPSSDELEQGQILKALAELSAEVKTLRQQIEARG